VDTGTGQPAFASFTVGLPTRRRLVFVTAAGKEPIELLVVPPVRPKATPGPP
jgi:hypothetical protein